MKQSPEKIVLLCGPTGSGKSEICEQLDENIFEVISFDSRQIYKNIPISSAQVPVSNRLRHHLTSIIEPSQKINAAQYSKLAFNALEDILSRNKVPVLTSGTGFYLKAFLYGMYEIPFIEESSRVRISKLTLKEKWSELQNKDSNACLNIFPNDDYRISRALEIADSGALWSEIEKNRVDSFLEKFKGEVIGFFLEWDRKKLYDRINLRCQKMIDDGFFEEAKFIFDTYGMDAPIIKTLGFNFALDYLNGKKTMETFFKEFTQSHRNYAKKQITWFKKEKLLISIDCNLALKEIKKVEKWFKNVN